MYGTPLLFVKGRKQITLCICFCLSECSEVDERNPRCNPRLTQQERLEKGGEG